MEKRILILLIILSGVLISGCKKDTDSRDSFVAIYSVSESWNENSITQTKPVFSMPVYKSSVDSKLVLLNNFSNYGIGITAEGTVTDNMLTIPQQTLPNLKTIVGSGTLSGNTLTLSYTESYNNLSFVISSIAKIK